MIPQDIVIAIANVVFALSLLPMLRAPIAPPLLSSIPTATCLWAIAISMATLDLRWSAFCIAVSASGWTVLAYKRIKATREARAVVARG